MKAMASDRSFHLPAAGFRGSTSEAGWRDLTIDANTLFFRGAHSKAIRLYAEAFEKARRIFEIARSRDRNGEEAVCILVASAGNAARNLEAWGAPQEAGFAVRTAVSLLIAALQSDEDSRDLKSAAARHLPRLLVELRRRLPTMPDSGDGQADPIEDAKAAALAHWRGLAT